MRDLPALPPFADSFLVEAHAGGRAEPARQLCVAPRVRLDEFQEFHVRHAFLIRQMIGEHNDYESVRVLRHVGQNVGMPPRAIDPYAVECGQRLRATREALGYPKVREFAADTGVTEDALSAWERGRNLVRQDYVRRLKRRFGVTFEWIFDGDASTLSRSLYDRIHGLAS